MEDISDVVKNHEKRITDLEQKQVPRIAQLEEAQADTQTALDMLESLVKSRDELVGKAFKSWPKAATYLLGISGVLIGALTVVVGVVALVR